jgi:hypothetical protein
MKVKYQCWIRELPGETRSAVMQADDVVGVPADAKENQGFSGSLLTSLSHAKNWPSIRCLSCSCAHSRCSKWDSELIGGPRKMAMKVANSAFGSRSPCANS